MHRLKVCTKKIKINEKPKSLKQTFFDNCIFAQFLKLHEPKRNRNYLIVFKLTV